MIRKKYLFELIHEKKNCLEFVLPGFDIHAYIFILEEDIVRVLFTEGGLKVENTWWVAPGKDDIPREGVSKWDMQVFSCPAYQIFHLDGTCVVETTRWKLVIRLDGFCIAWYDKQSGALLAQDRTTQSYNLNGSLGDGVFHYLERNRREQYYGLGERSGETNRYGRRFKMLNVDPMGYDAQSTDPLYKHIPFYITRNMDTKISFGIFYDNMSTAEFDMGQELDNYHSLYRYYTASDGDLDYYMILGPAVADVTRRFSWLTGKTILPPKWSIGYSGSTMSYTDAPDAQKRLLNFVALCGKHDIPCDSFQLSSGYTSIGSKRYVFRWNRDKVPKPEQMVHDFHENGLRLCANIKPALLWDHPLFSELEERSLFVRSADGTETELSQFWDEVGAYIDFTNPEAFDWWKKQVTKQLLAYGIDATWNDNNEYEIWDKEAQVYGFGKPMNIEKVKPLQTMLMMKASYEAQKEYAPNVRPYLISRSGSPGMQRYVQTWSGDNRTEWKTIRYNIKMGIGLSLSGVYNFGHDVGGFAGAAPDPELFIRWVQNGIFHPRFTIHSWNDDQTVNEPWMYPEALAPIRQAIKLRSRLTPFLYDLLYKAHTEYEPVIRPTFYNFEADEQTFIENDEFMLSDKLLIASVVEPGQRSRRLYLPECREGWYEYHSGCYFSGGQNVEVAAPLEATVFFARGGAILPVNCADITFERKDDDERGFELFPCQEEGRSSYQLYEDDGYTNDFTKGMSAFVIVSMESDHTAIRVTVSKTGDYVLPYPIIRFFLPKEEKRIFYLNGKESSGVHSIDITTL